MCNGWYTYETVPSGWGQSEGWDSHGAGAHETRLRLLTLQGQWLEIKGRMLAEAGSSGGPKVRRVVNLTAPPSFRMVRPSLRTHAEIFNRRRNNVFRPPKRSFDLVRD